EFGPKFKAAPLLRQMVRAGHLGKKTGRGFYEY
ncbi:MAG TPA: 3-hydroxybutyryl-CoA dehydrogenase, partial [Desulfotomaculum sp.]|nr:3-hydroxybutyryl-CoA dehydrogenase [Desulfotomaculum sp.]